jgi:streptogramin lyase
MGEMTNVWHGLVRHGYVVCRAPVRAAVLLGALFALGVAVAGAAPLGAITEFSGGLNAAANPTGIAAGPDGSLWFADPGGTPAIGRITPSGTITEFSSGMPAGSLPGGGTAATATAAPTFSNNGIAAGPDGNVWFSDDATPAAIGRITPSGSITEFRSDLNAGSRPTNVMAGPDGNVWFTDSGDRATPPTPAIGLICLTSSPLCSAADATSHTIHEIGLPTTPKLSVPGVIAAGPDGNLWFSDRATPAAPKIGRITSGGAITEFSLPATSVPGTLAAGPDGNVWFVDRVATGSLIGRITPTGTITEFGTGLTAASSLFSIAEGPDGNLWFTDRSTPPGGVTGGSTPAIGMVDPTTGTSTEFSLPAGRYPFGITAGPDGNVWFADRSGTSVTGVRTTAGTPGTATLVTGTFPTNLAAGTPVDGPGIPLGATVLSGANLPK